VGEESAFVFHGAPMLSNPRARDLILEKNPCHEEALEVALKAGVDFIFNVTLDSAFRVTGVYAGDLQAAHREAVAGLKAHVAIETDRKYDIVVTHAGFVGLNHYQAAKAAAAALPLLHPRSRLIMAADCHDRDPVGKETYRRVLPFLKERSAEDFETLLLSREWTFVPDQWQVQMWARLFKRIPQEQFTFFAPQLTEDDYGILPGVSDRETLLPNEDRSDLGLRLERSLNRVQEECRRSGMEEPSIAWLADGPYGIPYPKDGA
jgi:lactate racemase